MSNLQIVTPRFPSEAPNAFTRLNVIDNGDGTCSIYVESRANDNYASKSSLILPTGLQVVGSAAGTVTGSGTTGAIPKWADGPASVLDDSSLIQDGDDLSTIGNFTLATNNAALIGTLSDDSPLALIFIDGQDVVNIADGVILFDSVTGVITFSADIYAPPSVPFVLENPALGGDQSSISVFNGIKLQVSGAKVLNLGDADGEGNGTLIRIFDNNQIIQLTALSVRISYLTEQAFLYSAANGEISSTPAPTNGQLLIGDTGGIPTPGNITSVDNSVTVANGPGTIDLSVPPLPEQPAIANPAGGAVIDAEARAAIIGVADALRALDLIAA